jgi:DNA-damage-inducible protein J
MMSFISPLNPIVAPEHVVLQCSSGEPSMTTPTNTVVRARIDEQTKDEAAAVLATIGLTVSDAFRLMMVRIAQDKALPFEPLIPNADTVAAMKEARRGKLKRHANAATLLKKPLVFAGITSARKRAPATHGWTRCWPRSSPCSPTTLRYRLNFATIH